MLSFVDAARSRGRRRQRSRSEVRLEQPGRWVRANSLDDAACRNAWRRRFRLDWNPASGGKLFHHRRQLDDGQLIFLVNSSLEQKAAGTLKAKGALAEAPGSGHRRNRAVPGPASGADLDVAFDLPPAGSLLLVASNTGRPSPPNPSARRNPVRAAGPVTVKRLTPNTLTIDYCDLKLAGTVTKDMYYYTAAKKVFKHYGLEANPWDAAVQYKTNILDKNNFPAGFRLRSHLPLPRRGRGRIARPARRGRAARVVEGQRERQTRQPRVPANGGWTATSASTTSAAHVVEGQNAITIAASPMSVHNEIEPLYLTGDFGVEAQPPAGA